MQKFSIDSHSNESFICLFFRPPGAANPQKERRHIRNQGTPACKIWRESARGLSRNRWPNKQTYSKTNTSPFALRANGGNKLVHETFHTTTLLTHVYYQPRLLEASGYSVFKCVTLRFCRSVCPTPNWSNLVQVKNKIPAGPSTAVFFVLLHNLLSEFGPSFFRSRMFYLCNLVLYFLVLHFQSIHYFVLFNPSLWCGSLEKN